MSEQPIFKKGQLLILEAGSYSDYHIRGVFKVMKDLDTSKFPTEKSKYSWGSQYDTQRMINEGYLVDYPDVQFLHDGSY